MLDRRLFHWENEFSRRVLRLAVPIVIQSLVVALMYVVDNWMIGQLGDIKLGGGPVLCMSSVCSAPANRALEETARRMGLSVQYEVASGVMGTDADKMNQTNGGTPVTTVSIPLRYMHSPSEVGCLTDVEGTVELLSEFLAGLDETFNLDPFAI